MEEEKNESPLPSQDFLGCSEYLEFDLGVYIVYTEQLGTILPVMGNVAVRSRGIDQNSTLLPITTHSFPFGYLTKAGYSTTIMNFN